VSFNERRCGDVTILDMGGRLTYTSGTVMSQRVRSLAEVGPEHVVLNLGAVSYIDSAGLGALVEAFTMLRHRGGVLKLLNPTERTRRLLEITGLATLVATFDSESAALASFASHPA
jgi:anti-sigma B factor antagonist